MKNDIEFRGVMATEMAARLQVLGMRPSTFERCESLAHGTFKNI